MNASGIIERERRVTARQGRNYLEIPWEVE